MAITISLDKVRTAALRFLHAATSRKGEPRVDQMKHIFLSRDRKVAYATNGFVLKMLPVNEVGLEDGVFDGLLIKPPAKSSKEALGEVTHTKGPDFTPIVELGLERYEIGVTVDTDMLRRAIEGMSGQTTLWIGIRQKHALAIDEASRDSGSRFSLKPGRVMTHEPLLITGQLETTGQREQVQTYTMLMPMDISGRGDIHSVPKTWNPLDE